MIHEENISLVDLLHTVKSVLSSHSKIDKTKVLKTNGSLMKVKSIADLHLAIIGIENQILVFFLSGRLRQVLLLSHSHMHKSLL